jgi:hypothetical protein
VAALLRSATPEAAGLALDASGALRSAALGPALLELAARDIPGPSSFEPPLADDALRVLSRMTGAALPERPEAYTPMGVLTDQGREEARRAFQQRLQTLEPSRRYQEGQPLEYRHLVDELLSRHTGVAAAAAFNLRAMTGEDHGYEPYEDLVANVKAVQAWRARLTHLPALEPGDWLFAGAPVAPPS